MRRRPERGGLTSRQTAAPYAEIAPDDQSGPLIKCPGDATGSAHMAEFVTFSDGSPSGGAAPGVAMVQTADAIERDHVGVLVWFDFNRTSAWCVLLQRVVSTVHLLVDRSTSRTRGI